MYDSFYSNLARSFASGEGRVFVLDGNVEDIFPGQSGGYLSLTHVLAERLSATRDLVVFWDMAEGFTFADDVLEGRGGEMREKFRAITAPASGCSSGNCSTSGGSSSNLLAQVAAQMSSAASGAGQGRSEDKERVQDPAEAFPLIERVLTQTRFPAVVIVEYAESVLDDRATGSPLGVLAQKLAGIDSALRVSNNPLVLIERNAGAVGKVVRDKARGIHISRPSRDDLELYIAWAQVAYDDVELDAGMDAGMLANLASGLRAVDVENILMLARVDGVPVSHDYVWERKQRFIEEAAGGTLKVVQPKHGFEAIGGLDHVVKALQVQVAKLRRGDRTTDKGWLLMGPPGTGKTILAEALARESGVNFVVFGGIQSKWVGESERNMALALEIAKAMAPTIVFIDEAAEAVGNGDGYSGDSGVSDRLRGMLQAAMSDDAERGRLFFMLATNYPERMSAAMLRDGRVDKRIPLLLPDQEARVAILAAHCWKYGIADDALDFTLVAEATEGYSGAELEALLLRARQFAEEDGEEVSNAYLIEALEDYIPSRDEAAWERMTQSAIRFTNSRRLLPERYRQQYDLARAAENVATPDFSKPAAVAATL